MEDLVVPPEDQFSLQAQLHQQIQDSLNAIVSSFEIHHSTIVSQLNASQVEPYHEWWQKLKPQLLHQASLHGQMGKNLRTAGENYHTSDQNIAQVMQQIETQPAG